MNYKNYLLLLILFFFTACGELEKEKDNKPSLNSDKKLTCQQSKKKSQNILNYEYQNSFIVEPLDNIKLLVTKEESSQTSPSFHSKELYNLFRTEYYWASYTPQNFDYSLYTNPQKLIDDLRYEKDRWSFSVTEKAYNDVISQKSIGVGLRCQDFEDGCLITYVRMNSPADKIDLRRGDIITKINGIDATENLFYEKAKQKDELTIEIERRANNTICSGSIKPREYLYSVVKEKILKTEKNNKVAYLRVDSFLGEQSLKDKMDTIFNRLKKENIDRLIIDLRYNGGGSIDLASNLIDKLSIKNQKNALEL